MYPTMQRIIILSLLTILFSLLYHAFTTEIELLDDYTSTTQSSITSVSKAIIPESRTDTFKKYDYINTDIEYHESPEKILLTEKINDPITLNYSDGTSKTFRFGDVAGSPIYYKSGEFKYGAKTYVPTYEDSIYLSKSLGGSGLSNSKNTRTFTPEYYAIMNNVCKLKTNNECKVSDSCILLNKVSCVVGDEAGPAMDSVKFNKDVDHYYYKNKCYGAC
jgi:hypothetical protein